MALLGSGCAQTAQPSKSPVKLKSHSVATFGSGLSGGEITDSDWKKVVRKVLPSVAQVRIVGCGFTARGSGFRVGNWIITNKHVVEDAISMKLYLPGGKTIPVTSWRYVKNEDLALIRADLSGIPALKLNLKDSVSGDLIATGGYPLGGPQMSKRGRLFAKMDAEPGDSSTFVWQTTADIYHGDSGGPLIDINGNVAGVMFALDLENNLSLAIPVSRVRAMFTNPAKLAFGKPCKN